MDIGKLIVRKVNLPEYLSDKYNIELYNGRCCCPIHNGSTATSFKVSDEFAYCFSCGFHGNVIECVSELDNISYYAALEKLADELNISISDDEEYQKKRTQVSNNKRKAQACFKKNEACIDYLTKDRNLSLETIENFCLGFSKDGIVIPLRNYVGQYVAFAVRNMNYQSKDLPKYINSRNNDLYEKNSFLYNFDRAIKPMRKSKELYLCEGYFDVISADEQGIPCAGYSSADITKGQIELINLKAKDLYPQFTVYIAPDNDEEGQKRIPKVRDKFIKYAPRATVRVVIFPEGMKDFSDCHVNNIKIKDLPTEAIDMFVLKTLLSSCKSIEQEYEVAKQFVDTVSNDMIKYDCSNFLASRWGKDLPLVREWMKVSGDDDMFPLFKTAEEAVTELYDMYKHGHLTLGWEKVDESLSGVYKTEVVIFAARAGVAKTFLACSVALHMAIRESRRGLFFSLEMSAGALYARLISMFLGITIREVEKRILENDPSVLKIDEALKKRLYIIDNNQYINTIDKIDRVITYANQRIFESPCDFIIVDYIQYLEGAQDYSKFAGEVKKLKPLAKKHKIVEIILSQLNRNKKSYERPEMEDLRGGGDLEQEGDIIRGAYRPSKDPDKTMAQRERLKNVIMFNNIKSRRGCTLEEVPLKFNSVTSRIEEAEI